MYAHRLEETQLTRSAPHTDNLRLQIVYRQASAMSTPGPTRVTDGLISKLTSQRRRRYQPGQQTSHESVGRCNSLPPDGREWESRRWRASYPSLG